MYNTSTFQWIAFSLMVIFQSSNASVSMPAILARWISWLSAIDKSYHSLGSGEDPPPYNKHQSQVTPDTILNHDRDIFAIAYSECKVETFIPSCFAHRLNSDPMTSLSQLSPTEVTVGDWFSVWKFISPLPKERRSLGMGLPVLCVFNGIYQWKGVKVEYLDKMLKIMLHNSGLLSKHGNLEFKPERPPDLSILDIYVMRNLFYGMNIKHSVNGYTAAVHYFNGVLKRLEYFPKA